VEGKTNAGSILLLGSQPSLRAEKYTPPRIHNVNYIQKESAVRSQENAVKTLEGVGLVTRYPLLVTSSSTEETKLYNLGNNWYAITP
jgi:hypothetical protein